MVEEQATLAELQKIADEVSEAFHRRKWKVVVRDKGKGVRTESLLARITVPRAWLENPDLPEFRFGLVVGCVLFESVMRNKPFRFTAIAMFLLIGSLPFVSLGLKLFGLELHKVWLLAIIPVVCLMNIWLVKLEKSVIGSDSFVNRLLEASKDPEAVRDYLKKEKVSAETLAKFDAMVAAQG